MTGVPDAKNNAAEANREQWGIDKALSPQAAAGGAKEGEPSLSEILEEA
eukprot:CAMPEP_0173456004 /NCGR_PEP_ID=MMETSP1357-20121228/55297_1 /TAXON_ID=77926 /ORGANISM="Hemiselmis rufescens, Strain PCC563" /LENGTH=48 /DNA_ID= /DNA_START= /DNA_END= /DNA_ORIENTATION=